LNQGPQIKALVLTNYVTKNIVLLQRNKVIYNFKQTETIIIKKERNGNRTPALLRRKQLYYNQATD
jgi:hypothetical protein